MTDRPEVQGPSAKSFAKVSVLGFVIFAVWIAAVGGIVILAWGDAMGWLAVAAGVAVAALFATRRFRRSIGELGASRSYPARVFILNVLFMGLAGFFAYGYATDPYVAYNKRDLLTLIHFAVAEVIAIGAVVANVVAYRKDRQRISRT